VGLAAAQRGRIAAAISALPAPDTAYLVKDIAPGENLARLSHILSRGRHHLFCAQKPWGELAHRRPAGTWMVMDIWPGKGLLTHLF
jgi:hypothetical protein